MKRHPELPATWLVGSKTRLRALEPVDVPLLRRCRVAVDPEARGFIVQTIDGVDVGVLTLLVSGPHAAIAIGFLDDARFKDGSAADALRVMSAGVMRSMPIERVEALVPARLTQAVEAHRAAGFTEEGVLREVLAAGDEREDAVILSVLPRD